jgi:hypothetical protein
LVCAKPINFRLSPNGMTAETASRLHHARRAQPWDFHALELIEKPALSGICASLAH